MGPALRAVHFAPLAPHFVAGVAKPAIWNRPWLVPTRALGQGQKFLTGRVAQNASLTCRANNVVLLDFKLVTLHLRELASHHLLDEVFFG